MLALVAYGFAAGWAMARSKAAVEPHYARQYEVDSLERRLDRLEAYESARRELKAS